MKMKIIGRGSLNHLENKIIGRTYLNHYPPFRSSTTAAEVSRRHGKSKVLTQRSLGVSLSTVDGLPDEKLFITAFREKPEVRVFPTVIPE